jgi:hypothetical protein
MIKNEFKTEFEKLLTSESKDNQYFADFALEQLSLDCDSDENLEYLKEYFKGDFELIAEFYGTYHIDSLEELNNVSRKVYRELKKRFDQ